MHHDTAVSTVSTNAACPTASQRLELNMSAEAKFPTFVLELSARISVGNLTEALTDVPLYLQATAGMLPSWSRTASFNIPSSSLLTLAFHAIASVVNAP
jgi:hypothetical protein